MTPDFLPTFTSELLLQLLTDFLSFSPLQNPVTMSATKSIDRKEDMDIQDEKFVEVAKRQPATDGMTDHERTVLTRKILLKLDFR